MFEDVIRQNIFGHSVMVFYAEEPSCRLMVPELTELTVIDSLHDCIGGYDI